eukprot:scaffold141169_cov34-Attheya_sp.AAC.3
MEANTENSEPQGIVMPEQQPSDTQEIVEPDPIATEEESTAPAESEDQKEIPIGNLPGQAITDKDRKFMGVYGNFVHQNDSTHLDGGIEYDKIWQERWKKLAVLPTKQQDTPGGAIGRQFVEGLADELEGIRKRKWNSERFLVFQMVTLQRTTNVVVGA